MIIYKDILSGHELLDNSYDIQEFLDGFFFQVEGKWQGDVEADDIATSSAEYVEGADVGGEAQRVADLADAFHLHELPLHSKHELTYLLKEWTKRMIQSLPESEAAEFKAKAPAAVKFLMDKADDLQLFQAGIEAPIESTTVYVYCKDGASQPTFLYPKYALKGVET